MRELVIRAGTVVDGTGAPARTGRRRDRRRAHRRRSARIAAGPARDRRRRAARHARLRRHPHALRRPGDVGPVARAVVAGTASPRSSWATAASASRRSRPSRHEWLIELMEGVEDIPGTALAEGIRWDWESFPEYLDALERMPRAIDVGAQVPHGAVRAYVMGERGARTRRRPPDEIARDGGARRATALAAGALGFSTSRTILHRPSTASSCPARPRPTES